MAEVLDCPIWSSDPRCADQTLKLTTWDDLVAMFDPFDNGLSANVKQQIAAKTAHDVQVAGGSIQDQQKAVADLQSLWKTQDGRAALNFLVPDQGVGRAIESAAHQTSTILKWGAVALLAFATVQIVLGVRQAL